MDQVNARICARRDTTANWEEAIGFVPLLGEICIYTDHGTVLDEDDNPVNVPGIKIGDGVSLLSDLPFVSDDEQAQILTELRTHTANRNVHVTELDKAAWNAKADKAQSFTTGNFAVLDETGGIADSGHKHSDYLTEHQDISGKMDLSLKGAANGVAELGSDGKVPSGQLPSYVDDVLEYASLSEFPVTGESGKIYIALDTNKTYRWSGSTYAEISESLALGETSVTAYRGDRGAAAYAAAVTNVETTPTEDSANLITSGAVYAGLNEKADRTDIPEVPVQDVQVNGSSILSQGVANVPVADSSNAGVAKVNSNYGVQMTRANSSSPYEMLAIQMAGSSDLKSGSNYYKPVVPASIHQATFYGLAKAANADMASLSSVTVGQYPEAQKTAIQTMLDVPSQEAIADKETATATAAHAIGELFLMGGKLYKAKTAIAIGDTIVTSGVSANAEQTNIAEEIPAVPVTDVQVDGTSILNNGVANVPIAGPYVKGVVKVSSTYGLDVGTTNQHIGFIRINPATLNLIKNGGGYYNPLTVDHQHEAAFYGFAKAAGDTTQKNSANPVGSYTPEAKAAIWQMLGLDGSAFVQSEWELIREDTFTNAEEADHIITVDGNGNAFELTDVRLLFELPKVDATSSKGYYGQVWFYYGDSSSDRLVAEPSTFSRTTTTDYAKGCWYFIDYNDGMAMTTCGTPAINTNSTALKSRYVTYTANSADREMGIMLINDFSIKRINIKSVTGTGHYKLYGKRKRNGLDSPVINVSGTTPTITALPGHRYVCGEVSTLTIVAPASGCIDVTFTSGSTATVLTVSSVKTGVTAIKWANGFDPTSLDANTTYEVNILDGEFGVVGSWT